MSKKNRGKKRRNKKYIPRIPQIPGLRPAPTPKNEGALFSIFGTKVGELAHGLVEKKIVPEEGGMFVKLVGCSYLFKGYPSGMVMGDLKISKSTSWFIVGVLENTVVKLALTITFLISRKLGWRSVDRILKPYFKIAYSPLKNKGFLISDGKDYCKSVKELYRVSEIVLGMIKNKVAYEILSKLRDIGLLILQFDTVYRFTTQDILPEINIENLKKNTAKEIERVFRILMEREKPGDEREKYERIRRKVVLAARIPLVRKWILRFLTEINYDEVKLDEADWYYVLRRHCYKYGGVSYEDRLAEAKRIDKEKGHSIPNLVWVMKPQPHFEIIPLSEDNK